jgi:hypothetical protein
MKGTLHKTEQGWIVRWSDFHSFAHGTEWNDTLLHSDDQLSKILEEGKVVEIDIEYSTDFKTNWARLSDIYRDKKECEKFICEWVSKFLTENIDKINEKRCDLSGSGTSKEKLLKDVKKDIEWAMWVIGEVMNWGMDKDYTKELCPTVYEPEDYEYRVIKLDGKYIKIIYNKDYTHTVSFAREKRKVVIYFD